MFLGFFEQWYSIIIREIFFVYFLFQHEIFKIIDVVFLTSVFLREKRLVYPVHQCLYITGTYKQWGNQARYKEQSNLLLFLYQALFAQSYYIFNWICGISNTVFSLKLLGQENQDCCSGWMHRKPNFEYLRKSAQYTCLDLCHNVEGCECFTYYKTCFASH